MPVADRYQPLDKGMPCGQTGAVKGRIASKAAETTV
jgi:hypothetical protein